MTIWAIVPAAGIGLRMGSKTPKQYLPLRGKPVLLHSLEKLAALSLASKIIDPVPDSQSVANPALQSPTIQSIVVPVHAQDQWYQSLVTESVQPEFVSGGEQRQHSVLNGLLHLQARAQQDDWVLVHDAVRPCVLNRDIENLLLRIANHSCGGLLGAPVVSTLKKVGANGEVVATLDRTACWQAYTPQIFRYGLLRDSLEQAIANDLPVTDEAGALEAAGYSPLLVEGDHWNIKITHESDLQLADMILQQQVDTHESY